MNNILNMEKILYHYTTGSGLLGMIKDYSAKAPNIKLWASHYMYMNDPREYEIGKYICTEIINNIEDKLGIPEEFRVKPFVESPAYRIVLNDLLRTSDGQSICPYLISLSCAYDSLHMWDMYASNGNGVAIGFNRPKLFGANILTKDCHYCNPYCKEDIEQTISEIESSIKEIYLDIEKDYPLAAIQKAVDNGDKSQLHLRLHIIYTLACWHIGSRVKDRAFELEDEVRITPRIEGAAKIFFRDRNGIIIPYIEYPIPFNCVENIIVGPTADFNRVRESILILLDTKGIKWNEDKILRSNVPYRL